MLLFAEHRLSYIPYVLFMNLFKKNLPAFNTKHVTLHVLVWGALLGLPYLFHAGEGLSIATNTLPQLFFTVTNVLHAILFYLNAYWVQPRFFNKGRRWQYVLATLILIGVFFCVKILLFQFGIFTFPLESSMMPMLFFPVVLFVLVSIVYRLVIDKINVENEQLKMELKFLRSQVSPHFLFNVLNNMVSMARKKSDKLEASLIKLSDLMRYMLYESGDRTVPLTKEVQYLKSYIELQKIRFSDGVPIRVHLSEVKNSHKIEPMLLIPFVENAFKHGVGLIEDPMIEISLSVDEEILFFEVMNRFDTDDKQKDLRSGIGLKNVKKRLELLYPDRHQIEISQSDNIFKVHLRLTLR